MNDNMQKSCIIRSRSKHERGKMSLHEIDVYRDHLLLKIYGASTACYTIHIQEGRNIMCSCRQHALVPSICEHSAFVLETVFETEEIPIETYVVTSKDYQRALNPYTK